MAALLTRDEVVVMVERVLSGLTPSEEAVAWLTLGDRSLGVPDGTLRVLLEFPEQTGLPLDATGEEVVALALERGAG